MFAAKPAAEQAGFKFWKPLVWDKCAIGMGYHYRARYEFILFFEKGKRKLNNLSIPDISPADANSILFISEGGKLSVHKHPQMQPTWESWETECGGRVEMKICFI